MHFGLCCCKKQLQEIHIYFKLFFKFDGFVIKAPAYLMSDAGPFSGSQSFHMSLHHGREENFVRDICDQDTNPMPDNSILFS